MTGTGHTWLAVMGAASSLGSEPMVGWQWVQRTRARGPVTPIMCREFDRAEYLPDAVRQDTVFIDTRAPDSAHFARHHLLHLWRWWRGVRAHLKAHAGPHDRLLITVPAAIWMLPWIGGLPIARDRVFFGPLGADWVPSSITGRWPGMRNLRTAGAIAAWRMLAPWLPGHLALRAPSAQFERRIGRRFIVHGAVPEVEPPPMTLAATAPAPAAVLVLHDARPRKRFQPSFGYALALAGETGLPLVLVDVPRDAEQGLARRASAAGVTVRFQPRLDRAGFQALLRDLAPHVVSLSSSEGIPSTLIEALLAGGRIHAHAVGGLTWLLDVGRGAETRAWKGAPVVSVGWDADSVAAFRERAHAGMQSLLDVAGASTEVTLAS